jgi:hypothetical protein
LFQIWMISIYLYYAKAYFTLGKPRLWLFNSTESGWKWTMQSMN